MISDPDLYRFPKALPILTPIIEVKNVITPITMTAKTTFTRRVESKTLTGEATNVIPTASASMLVAIAIKSMVLTSKPGDTSSSGPKASLIIFPPIRDSRMKVTQGATVLISFSNPDPTR